MQRQCRSAYNSQHKPNATQMAELMAVKGAITILIRRDFSLSSIVACYRKKYTIFKLQCVRAVHIKIPFF